MHPWTRPPAVAVATVAEADKASSSRPGIRPEPEPKKRPKRQPAMDVADDGARKIVPKTKLIEVKEKKFGSRRKRKGKRRRRKLHH